MGLFRVLRRWMLRAVLGVAAFFALWIAAYALINPPTTFYMQQESWRHDGVKQDWVDVEDIAPVMLRAVVAAEDANFCTHWGIDGAAVRRALKEGAIRGGSTISQQTVKNAFLWQGRSWVRKAIEAVLTPASELVWSKRRILEIYLNIIEFDTGVFGIQAAAQHHFGVNAADLTPHQAARLAAVLPNPKAYSAVSPTAQLRNRAAAIMDGAETIRRDGRASCFEG